MRRLARALAEHPGGLRRRRSVEREVGAQRRELDEVGLAPLERRPELADETVGDGGGVGPDDAAVDERDRADGRPVDRPVADRAREPDVLHTGDGDRLDRPVLALEDDDVGAGRTRPRLDDGEEEVEVGVDAPEGQLAERRAEPFDLRDRASDRDPPRLGRQTSPVRPASVAGGPERFPNASRALAGRWRRRCCSRRWALAASSGKRGSRRSAAPA